MTDKLRSIFRRDRVLLVVKVVVFAVVLVKVLLPLASCTLWAGSTIIQMELRVWSEKDEYEEYARGYLELKYGWDSDDYSLYGFQPYISWGSTTVLLQPSLIRWDATFSVDGEEYDLKISPEMLNESFYESAYDSYQADEIAAAAKETLGEIAEQHGYSISSIRLSGFGGSNANGLFVSSPFSAERGNGWAFSVDFYGDEGCENVFDFAEALKDALADVEGDAYLNVYIENSLGFRLKGSLDLEGEMLGYKSGSVSLYDSEGHYVLDSAGTGFGLEDTSKSVGADS